MLKLGEAVWVDPLLVESVSVVRYVITVQTIHGNSIVSSMEGMSLSAVEQLAADFCSDVAAAKGGA